MTYSVTENLYDLHGEGRVLETDGLEVSGFYSKDAHAFHGFRSGCVKSAIKCRSFRQQASSALNANKLLPALTGGLKEANGADFND